MKNAKELRARANEFRVIGRDNLQFGLSLMFVGPVAHWLGLTSADAAFWSEFTGAMLAVRGTYASFRAGWLLDAARDVSASRTWRS